MRLLRRGPIRKRPLKPESDSAEDEDTFVGTGPYEGTRKIVRTDRSRVPFHGSNQNKYGVNSQAELAVPEATDLMDPGNDLKTSIDDDREVSSLPDFHRHKLVHRQIGYSGYSSVYSQDSIGNRFSLADSDNERDADAEHGDLLSVKRRWPNEDDAEVNSDDPDSTVKYTKSAASAFKGFDSSNHVVPEPSGVQDTKVIEAGDTSEVVDAAFEQQTAGDTEEQKVKKQRRASPFPMLSGLPLQAVSAPGSSSQSDIRKPSHVCDNTATALAAHEFDKNQAASSNMTHEVISKASGSQPNLPSSGWHKQHPSRETHENMNLSNGSDIYQSMSVVDDFVSARLQPLHSRQQSQADRSTREHWAVPTEQSRVSSEHTEMSPFPDYDDADWTCPTPHITTITSPSPPSLDCSPRPVDFTAREQQMGLKDGRTLSFSEYGDLEGHPIILIHPFGANRTSGAELQDLANRMGIRLIVPDRPGAVRGQSSPFSDFDSGAIRRGQCDITQLWLLDLVELIYELDLPNFGVLGMSVGTAYALATAHWLDEMLLAEYVSRPASEGQQVPKLKAVGVVSAMVPKGYGTKGMKWQLRAMWNAAVHIPGVKKLIKKRMLRSMMAIPLEEVMSDRTLPSNAMASQANLALPPKPDTMEDIWPHGVDAAVLELEALTRKGKNAWGFLPEEIQFVAPDGYGARFFHGSKDELFPVQNVLAMASGIQNGHVGIFNGGTHDSIADENIGQVLKTMVQAMLGDCPRQPGENGQ